MWTNKENETYLDVSKINPEEFKIVSANGLTLICPKKNKFDWTEEEKWLRSIVVDETGLVVSCSWKKFGNFGEGQFKIENDKLIDHLENNKAVHFTKKEDGTLCIRSVINGKINFRTRGTLDGNPDCDEGSIPFGRRFLSLAERKYPRLLDASWCPHMSLLLEYVAPDNTIVIHYKEEDFIFLGGVYHFGPRNISWERAKEIAKEGGFKLVELIKLPNNITELCKEIENWKDKEGVVARCDNTFVKVKSAWYLANHRIKSNLNYKTLLEIIDQEHITCEKDIENVFQARCYDYEIIEEMKKIYQVYLRAVASSVVIYNEACGYYQECRNYIRKDYAKVACSKSQMIKTLMFLLYDEKPGDKVLKNYIEDYDEKAT